MSDYSDIPGPWVVVNDHCQLREWGGRSSKRDVRNALAVWAFKSGSSWEWSVFTPTGGFASSRGLARSEGAMRDEVARALAEVMDKAFTPPPVPASRATVWDRLLLEDDHA